MDTGVMSAAATTKDFIVNDSVLLHGRQVPSGIPDWLVATVEAAGSTAFTDEFDGLGVRMESILCPDAANRMTDGALKA
jgi:hypothetical protein